MHLHKRSKDTKFTVLFFSSVSMWLSVDIILSSMKGTKICYLITNYPLRIVGKIPLLVIWESTFFPQLSFHAVLRVDLLQLKAINKF